MVGADPFDARSGIDILHVDDEPDVADLTKTFLEREDDGFSVTIETDPRAALDRVQEHRYDCVVSDYEMPGMNGIEFLKTIRASEPALPFILFTGRGSEEVASDAISAGVSDYLQKSPGREQYELLANRIVTHVERSRGIRDRRRQLDAIETAREGISILDSAGRFVFVNQAYADLYGYSRADMLGMHWSNLYPADEVESIRDDILPTVESTGYWRGETTGLRSDGSTFIEDHSLSKTDGGGLVCTVRDISDSKQDDQALRRYEVIVEAVDDAIYVLDQDERLEFVNQSYAEMKGVEREQLIGTPIDRWVDQTTLDAVRSRINTIETGTDSIGTMEYDFQTADGDSIPAEIRLTSLELPNGEHGRIGVIRDIQDRRERIEELERYETILEALGDPVYVADREGRFTFVNDAYLEQPYIAKRGLTKEDVIGARGSIALSEEAVEKLLKEIRALLKAEDREKSTVETVREAPDGTTTVVETHLALLPPDEEGRFRGTAGVIRDITDRKERQRELEQLRDRLHLALGDTRAWLWEVDLETEMAIQIPVSGSTANSTDRRERPVSEFHGTLHPDDRDRVADAFWRAAARQSDFHEEYRIPVEDAYHWVESRGRFHAATDNSNDRMIGIALDVSDRKERERELERQNERLEAFASIVSHDLRNPLTVARGNLDLLRADCESDHIEAIDRAHERMDQLIGDLLALARSGQQVESLEAVNLESVGRKCWKTVETENATVNLDADRTILADRTRLKQLIENAYRNAVEHAGPDVTIEVGTLDDGFYIADDGPGITAADVRRIFESGYTRSEEGIGFGLSIVKAVVDAHGWEVDVGRSNAGGARFEFTDVDFVPPDSDGMDEIPN